VDEKGKVIGIVKKDDIIKQGFAFALSLRRLTHVHSNRKKDGLGRD
jgi:hypothetical protein